MGTVVDFKYYRLLVYFHLKDKQSPDYKWTIFNVHKSFLTMLFNLYEKQKSRERKRIKLQAHM